MRSAGRVLLFLATVLTVCLPPAARAGEADAPADFPGGPSFVERFERLDQRRWFVSDGWTNGEHQRCAWSGRNVAIPVPGRLELLLNNRPFKDRAYSCAEIQTNEFYGYGTYEVRMRSGAASGLVSAFFTYTGPQHDDGRPHDEIDFEFLGKDARTVQLNYFASAQGQHEKVVALDFDASTRAADYAFEWLPDRLRWYIDGRLVHEALPKDGEPFPRHASKIFLSIWNGQGPDMDPWLGPAEYRGRPISAAFERVAFTRAGDACQFPTSLVCRSSARRSDVTMTAGSK